MVKLTKRSVFLTYTFLTHFSSLKKCFMLCSEQRFAQTISVSRTRNKFDVVYYNTKQPVHVRAADHRPNTKSSDLGHNISMMKIYFEAIRSGIKQDFMIPHQYKTLAVSLLLSVLHTSHSSCQIFTLYSKRRILNILLAFSL